MANAAVGVVVVAAGAGTRLGADVPKAFVSLGGRSILERALEPILGLSEPAQIVVVVPDAEVALAQDLVRRASGAAVEYVSVVPGGATRQQSVALGLDSLWPDVGVVLVHDAARPFAPTALFAAVVERVRATGEGVIPGLPVADTLKRTTTDGVAGETVDRSVLSAIQTPQGFPRVELIEAYSGATDDHTDDAALFAAAGHVVHVLAGDPRAFKITTTWDLHRAEQLVVPVAGFRSGIGLDIHAYDDSAPLWLGAIAWPDEPGLAGHSDGDALSHAICDALLSAAGLGDIGARFGTVDPRFAGAHGDVFITATVALVRGAGFDVVNVAVQVIGNHPRLAARRAEVERRLTELVGAPVSVSATTSDGLGFTGSGEGLAAVATALLTSGGGEET